MRINDHIIIGWVRYSLTRGWLCVSEVESWLPELWPDLLPGTREVIQRDVERAISGMKQPEKADWDRVAKLWRQEGERQK